MNHVLAILPTGSYRATDIVEAARALSIDLAVASDQPHALLPPDRFVEVDCARPDEAAAQIVDFGDRAPIDAIVTFDEGAVLTASLAAEQLGLPHNPPDAVAATRNKAMLRRALDRREIPQPAFELTGPSVDARAIAEFLGTPVVLKPLSLTGSRGVIRVDDPSEAPQAAERIARILIDAGQNPNQPILMERFVPGPEVVVEGLVTAGIVEVLAVIDKPEPLNGPYFGETLFVTPSRLHPEVVDEVVAVTQRAVNAIGLTEGPIHAELRIDDGAPVLLEIAARTIGGLCGRSLRFGLLGTTLEELVLAHAVGRRLSTRRTDPASGAAMLPVPTTGVFHRLDGLDAARAIPGITGVEVTAVPGSIVRALPEGDAPLGFLFARGATPADVQDSLEAARRLLVPDIRRP